MDLMDVTGPAKKKLKMDVTASSSSSTSSSSTAQWKYDVFLSFRGKDTRNSFTDIIYNSLIEKNIITFKDDVNLEKGKRISELFKKIEESRFAIVIFSKDYASSTWCLDELAKIVQCEKEMRITIIPVFYDVEPSDVRPEKEKGTFALALIEHEKKSRENVQQWRDALTHVSYISGWTVMNRPQAQIIKSIVEQMMSEKQWPLTYEEISRDLKKLELTMSTIQVVLQDAEEKQVKNQGLTVWLGQVKDVFYEAVDVRDEFECEALRREVVKRHGSTDSASYSSFNPRDFSHKIKVIGERFEEIAKVRAQFHLVERLDDKHIVQREMTHSFVHDSAVIGRVDDKNKIIDLLMQPCDVGTVPVISIVGIGGQGKTTLAQWVYNDETVTKFFDPRIWVCVSEEFTVLKLAKEILKSTGGSISENMSMNDVPYALRSNLEEKKFLIVLDDVWNEDRNKWFDLKGLLIVGANGSKIVVTTRSHKVAEVMAPVLIHDLKGLSEDDCWSLFLKWAFIEGKEKQYPKLVEIGKQIVKNCSNVPLAVRTLGSLLYSKTEERDWISVKDDEIWRLEQKEDDILPVLRLSYNHLPFYLKQCFAYCSLFPKDFNYYSVDLIKSWMANGLLQKSNKSTADLEDIGRHYLNELVSKSFFQEIEQDNYLSFTFKMHDLFHDLSLYVAQNDYYCLIDSTKSTKNFEKARHVSIWDNNLDADEATQFLDELSKNVRTITLGGDEFFVMIDINKSFMESCILRFKHLRLLDLRHSTLKALPSSIGTLKQLRYLNLMFTCIKKLPNSICDLQNLETLILYCCYELKKLPRDIRKLVSIKYFEITTRQRCLPTNEIMSMCTLRELVFYSCPGLESFPEGIQRLTTLRRLSFSCCKRLISLPQGLKHLTALEKLEIDTCVKINLMEGEDYPTSLRSLTISLQPALVALPCWLTQSATTLQFLEIGWLENLAVLPEWLPNLTSLQNLQIGYCKKLSSLPEGMGRLTALRELKIENCGELNKNCEREVGVEWPKIKHIPQIQIKMK